MDRLLVPGAMKSRDILFWRSELDSSPHCGLDLVVGTDVDTAFMVELDACTAAMVEERA